MDVFMGYNEDTCASIVTNLMQDPNLFEDEVKPKHYLFSPVIIFPVIEL